MIRVDVGSCQSLLETRPAAVISGKIMQYRSKIPIAIDRYLLDGMLIALLVILYAPVIAHWYDGWLHKGSISLEHEYFSHGLIQLPDTSHPLGIALLILGGVCYLSGQSQLVNISFPAVLVGTILWFKGVPGLKLYCFPLILVLLATPTAVPYLVAPYAMPLQRFIAGTAGFILAQFGMKVAVDQIYVSVDGRVVEVGAYCSGLKMLFNSLYLGIMLLYWSGAVASRKTTTAFLVGAVIISICASVFRNPMLIFFHGTGQESAFKWLHEGWGGHVYSAGILVLLVPLLNAIEGYFGNKGSEENL